ncbi:MAG: glycosyltransferase, partial [Flavobacteriaceae bacterium]|nr:glycosyltransferase [Flavobacteriaceae bacterium]
MKPNFSLIVCTYMRPEALCRLLDSVQTQSCSPTEIIIVDGSTDERSELAVQQKHYAALRYHRVKPEERGLTKQRNIGISLLDENTEIVCFL